MKKVLVGATALVLTTSVFAGPVTPESGKDLSTDIMSVGWAKNKAIGLEYNSITKDNKTYGAKQSETKTITAQPFILWNIENFSAEFFYNPTTEKLNPISGTSTKTDTDVYDLKGAYRFHKNIALILGYNSDTTKSTEDDTPTKTKTSLIDFGLSYKSDSNIFAAASYSKNNKKKTAGPSTVDVDFSTAKVGIGYENSNDDGGYALNLYYESTDEKKKTINDLTVIAPNSRAIGLSVNYVLGSYDFDVGIVQNNGKNSIESTKTESIEYSFDLEFSATENFYIAPGITISTGEDTNSAVTPATKTDTDSSEYRFVLGYRNTSWDLTGTVYQATDKTKTAAENTEDKGTGFKVNVGYLF